MHKLTNARSLTHTHTHTKVKSDDFTSLEAKNTASWSRYQIKLPQPSEADGPRNKKAVVQQNSGSKLNSLTMKLSCSRFWRCVQVTNKIRCIQILGFIFISLELEDL